ncbi:MAG TPA: hypothetical protein VI299_05565 [Polyangiales bacterium]
MSIRRLFVALPTWLLAIYVVVYVARGHLPYVQYPYEENMDEGYLMAVGVRMVRGHLVPYVDGVAHSGPLYLYLGALLASFDQFGYLALRWASLICFCTVALFTYGCGRAAGKPLAGAVATTAVPLYSLFWLSAWDGIALNAETPVNVFSLAAFYAVICAVGSPAKAPSIRWTAAAGALLVVSALFKQVGALLGLPIVVYFAAWLWHRSELDTKAKGRFALTFLVAGAIPVMLVLLWSALQGGLRDLYYYVVVYNRDIYMAPLKDQSRLKAYYEWIGNRPLEMTVFTAAVMHAASQWIAARRTTGSWYEAYLKNSFAITVSALCVAALIGARASMREFAHYFLLMAPWVGLMAGSLIDTQPRDGAARSSWLTAASDAAVALPLIAVIEMCASIRAERLRPWIDGHNVFADGQYKPPMCAVIDAHTKRGDPIFVWGFRAEYYIGCARLPASRYVFTTFVAGIVPWNFHTTKEAEDKLAVPGSRGILLSELEQIKPRLLIDTGETWLGGHSINRYDELRDYVARHYHPAENVQGEQVYVRNDEPPPPPAAAAAKP